MRRIIILSFIKLIPAPPTPGSESPFVPGFLGPVGPRNHPFSSRSLCHGTYISTSLSLRRTTAPSRKPFWVLGVWVVVWVKADYLKVLTWAAESKLKLAVHRKYLPSMSLVPVCHWPSPDARGPK